MSDPASPNLGEPKSMIAMTEESAQGRRIVGGARKVLEGEGNADWFLGDGVQMTRRRHSGYLMAEAIAVGCLRAEATRTNAYEANGEMRRRQRILGGRNERWAGRREWGWKRET